MSRRLIAFLIALVAIFFAFACLTAIRWPSMMMVVTLFFHPDPSLGLEPVNWRELGFAYGAQETETLPLEPTDQPLDMIVTESGVLPLSGR